MVQLANAGGILLDQLMVACLVACRRAEFAIDVEFVVV